MIKIGAVTIGQAPRVDVTADILPLLPNHMELVEKGALDPFTYEEITARFAPEGGTVLVSRMRDGRQVRMEEEKILGLLQQRITELEEEGCVAIIMLCTGNFPEFEHRVPLLEPCGVLQSITGELVGRGPVGLIVPDEKQVASITERWAESGISAVTVAASPYLGMAGVEAAAEALKGADIQLIIANCIGYSAAMRARVREITGCPVILPRTLIARIVTEIYA